MPYTVEIRNNATGETRTALLDVDWHDYSVFWWTEGNMGCDCNREDEFEAAGGNFQSNADCGNGRFTVTHATLPDGTVILIDPVEDEEE